MYFFNILVVVILTINTSYAQDIEQTCMDVSQAPNQVQGQNKVKHSSQPLFRLHFAELALKEGQTIEEEYKVQVSVVNTLKGIKTVKIITETNDTCGIGQFKFDHSHFVQNNDPSCPGVLETKTQQTLLELPPLVWSPPSCGCVKLRVIVVDDDDLYYMDDKNVQNGHLSQTVCVEMRRTRNQYLEALCSVSNRSSTPNIVNSQSFISRRNLDAKTMDKYNLMIDLEYRRTHNRDCCRKQKFEDKVDCLDDNRRRRLDNFCAYGFTDIPFAHFRDQHMRDKEKKCCRFLGEPRFICFGIGSEITDAAANATFLDFSMDDSDPANDVATFASAKDEEVLKLFKFVKFQPKSLNTDRNDDHSLGASKEQNTDALNTTPKAKTPGSDRSGESKSHVTRDPGASKEVEKKHFNRGSGEKRHRNLDGDDPTDADGVGNVVRGKKSGSSTEKITRHHEWILGVNPKKVDAQMSGERKGENLGSRSGERKGETFGSRSGERKGDNLGSRSGERKGENLGSKESKRQGRASMERNSGSLVNVNDDVPKDDLKGGSSISITSQNIRVKLERLKLKSQCCGAGEISGSAVISRTTLKAVDECQHGAEKYAISLKLTQGFKICSTSYATCCIETAITPKMTSSEFKRSPYMAYNNEDKDPEVENVQPDFPDEEKDEFEKHPSTHRPRGQPLGPTRDEEKAPNPDEAEEEAEEDEMNGPQKFDALDNEDDSADVLQRLELPRETEMSRPKDKENDGMPVEHDTGLEDLSQEFISPNKAKKKPKVKEVFKAERHPQHKARKNSGTKQKHAGKAGPLSKPRKSSKERSSREKTSRERIPSRVRRTSAESVRLDDQVKVHGTKQDIARETKFSRAKSTKKAMDSQEMSMLFYGQDGNGQDEKQGRQPRKSRWPSKG